MSQFASYPSLAGRVVFVSGGGSGIGASIVEHFAAQGAKVGFVDIDEPASKALVEKLGAAGYPRAAVRQVRRTRHRGLPVGNRRSRRPSSGPSPS